MNTKVHYLTIDNTHGEPVTIKKMFPCKNTHGERTITGKQNNYNSAAQRNYEESNAKT